MANLKKSVPENVPGPFFVDLTCIDCDTCRQLAPAVFGEAENHAHVAHQPTAATRYSALQALVCCPTGSIGSREKEELQSVLGGFPMVLEEPVHYCGFNSPKSYGGNSYFIRHPAGNWLVDSPKFLPRLVQRFEELGGLAHIFLTHQDDVADAALYAKHFGSQRIIHQTELSAQPGAERVLEGGEPQALAPEFLAIPTPGHTQGHCVLLFRDRFLFTGDHLAWDRHEHCLTAFRDYCWYSWPDQVESLARLANYSFEWVLPGHGQRVQLPAAQMRQQLQALVARVRER
jgi:glyoxylase-like metal-dependent hydrolase (beta-lactamase superfamily II)/ferredoxin